MFKLIKRFLEKRVIHTYVCSRCNKLSNIKVNQIYVHKKMYQGKRSLVKIIDFNAEMQIIRYSTLNNKKKLDNITSCYMEDFLKNYKLNG